MQIIVILILCTVDSGFFEPKDLEMSQHKKCLKELIMFTLKEKRLSRNIITVLEYLKTFHLEGLLRQN